MILSASRKTGARGFTLVEMLVSLAIFAVITAFTTANFNAARQGDELRVASQLMASAMRRAQTAAAAGETVRFCRGGTNDLRVCPNGTAAECPGGTCSREVPEGFGVHLSTAVADARKLIAFADLDGDRTYDVGEALRTESISPGPQVSVSAVSPVAGAALDVVFAPPKPTAYFNGAVGQATGSVTLRHAATGTQKTVSVNRLSGQINAE